MLRSVLLAAGMTAVGLFGCSLGDPPAIDARQDSWLGPPSSLPHEGDRLLLREDRLLAGDGPLAFDASRPQLAWAAGETLHELNLSDGTTRQLDTGAWISDLAYSPTGELWAIAGRAIRWRDGTEQCRSEDFQLDRLLRINAAGLSAARYWHSDGIGPVRHQVWVDLDCRLVREADEPLPAGVRSAAADPALFGRAPEIPAGLPWTVEDASVRSDGAVLSLPSKPLAISRDGRWWVFEESGRRSLWRLAEPD